MHPTDAGKLGLATGDVVKVHNERGAVLGGVLVTERIVPGAVYPVSYTHLDVYKRQRSCRSFAGFPTSAR